MNETQSPYSDEENSVSFNPENLREITREIASVVIISKDGKFLMGQKNPDKGGVYPEAWHIPGGGIEEGESLKEAARREAMEEVGLEINEDTLTPVGDVGSGESTKVLPNGEKVWCNMNFHRFEVRLDLPANDVSVSPSSDLINLQWFTKEELVNVDQIPGGKEFFISVGYLDEQA